MNYPELFVKYDSSTSFFSLFFISISSLHVFSRKYTLLKLEIDAIIRKCTRKDLTLHLLNELIYGISKGKVAF